VSAQFRRHDVSFWGYPFFPHVCLSRFSSVEGRGIWPYIVFFRNLTLHCYLSLNNVECSQLYDELLWCALKLSPAVISHLSCCFITLRSMYAFPYSVGFDVHACCYATKSVAGESLCTNNLTVVFLFLLPTIGVCMLLISFPPTNYWSRFFYCILFLLSLLQY
jgi:hypothetical protein